MPVEALNFCFPLDFSIDELAPAVLCGKTLSSADLHLQRGVSSVFADLPPEHGEYVQLLVEMEMQAGKT